MSIEKGTKVRFRRGTPPYCANMNSVFVVDSDPLPDNSAPVPPRFYVRLLLAEDVNRRPYSRQRRRSGYLDALEIVET